MLSPREIEKRHGSAGAGGVPQFLKSPQPFIFSAEWGWRYYLASMGGDIVADDTTGRAGELFIKSDLALGQVPNTKFGHSLQLVEHRTYQIRSPLRLLDPSTHAGFWSDGWGVLPFWFSWGPLDQSSVYRATGN